MAKSRSSESKKWTKGKIAGLVVGIVLAITLIVLLIVLLGGSSSSTKAPHTPKHPSGLPSPPKHPSGHPSGHPNHPTHTPSLSPPTSAHEWYNIFTVSDSDGYGYKEKVDAIGDDYKEFADRLKSGVRTALWMDTFDHIQFLDDALAHMKSQNPPQTKIIAIVYNLPNRDCHASSSNGSYCCLPTTDYGYCAAQVMVSYQTQNKPCQDILQYKAYIDEIVKYVEANPGIDFHLVIEPDSFTNIITNTKIGGEQTNNGNCGVPTAVYSYFAGIDYALRQLTGCTRGSNGTLDVSKKRDNVYCYIDLAHPMWMGWDLAIGAPDKGCTYGYLNGDSSMCNGMYGQYGTYDLAKASLKASLGVLDGDDSDYMDKDLFWYDTKDWPTMCYGVTLNTSNYNPLGTMCGSSGIVVADDGAGGIMNYCGNPTEDASKSQPDGKPCCAWPCNNFASYNPLNNLSNMAAFLLKRFPGGWNNEDKPPRILIDTSRNGHSEVTYEINRRELLNGTNPNPGGKAEPCASWCNIMNMTIGEGSFDSTSDDGLAHPVDDDGQLDTTFISYAYLKPPGESDGCVTDPYKTASTGQAGDDAGAVGKGCASNSSCVRMDTMCGIQFTAGGGSYGAWNYDSTKWGAANPAVLDYARDCPPEAGVWDDNQFNSLMWRFTHPPPTPS